MIYAEIKGTELIRYPYGFAELQNDNPYTNYGNNTDVTYWFPQTKTAIENGYTLAEVVFAIEPAYDQSNQVCAQNENPTLINGSWVLGWTVSEMTPEQKSQYNAKKIQENKQQAEQILSQTDWTQVADVPLLNKQEFTDYRSVVRAIALKPPVQVIFPEPPVEQWS